MPTIEAGSLYVNIAKSVNAYIQAKLVTVLGLTVYYEGANRAGTLPQRWVEAYLTPGVAVQEPRTAGYKKHSTWLECYLNLNFFEQELSAPSNLYTLMGMVDSVRAHFDYNASIPINDYGVVGTPKRSALRVLEVPVARAVPIDQSSGIKQINLSVPMRYHNTTAD